MSIGETGKARRRPLHGGRECSKAIVETSSDGFLPLQRRSELA